MTSEADETKSNNNMTNDWSKHEDIPNDIVKELESGAYRSVCSHLRERSDTVANIDLMTLSGFCRNCLAKWLVVEARQVSNRLKQKTFGSNEEEYKHVKIIKALDAFTYDNGAEVVYGCAYSQWKKCHSKKATEEQMKSFEESKPLWAEHDKEMLKPIISVTSRPKDKPKEETTEITITPSQPLLSNVCCQNVDEAPIASPTISISSIPTPTVLTENVTLNVGILTVSDRASSNLYETGDLSGPAVQSSLLTELKSYNESYSSNHICNILQRFIVPDEISSISQTLTQWSSSKCNLIFTSGGTGFSPRDITPEATKQVLTLEASGLLSYVSTECAVFGKQPMAALSRGVAGIIRIENNSTFVVNLPGNPGGIAQIMKILLPLLLVVIRDLEQDD